MRSLSMMQMPGLTALLLRSQLQRSGRSRTGIVVKFWVPVVVHWAHITLVNLGRKYWCVVVLGRARACA